VRAATGIEGMHFGFVRDTKILVAVGVALLIASCAQQTTKSVPTTSPSPAETKSSPTQTPTAAPKPKSKPKLAPKPETVETEPTLPVPIEGIEQSKVGYYFDTLQGRLRQLADPNLVVNRQGNQITIDLTHSVHLDDGNPSAPCTTLEPIAKALVEYRMTRAVIDVVAESGDAASVRSAKSRSESIAKCLADAGVANRRIASNGVPGAAPAIRLRIDPIVRNP
jgi:hypothetical protein